MLSALIAINKHLQASCLSPMPLNIQIIILSRQSCLILLIDSSSYLFTKPCYSIIQVAEAPEHGLLTWQISCQSIHTLYTSIYNRLILFLAVKGSNSNVNVNSNQQPLIKHLELTHYQSLSSRSCRRVTIRNSRWSEQSLLPKWYQRELELYFIFNLCIPLTLRTHCMWHQISLKRLVHDWIKLFCRAGHNC